MKTIYFNIVALFIFTMTSCTNPYEKEIKEVEELQVVLAGVKTTYQSIELEKVVYAKETYSKNMEQIQTYYKPDSVDQNAVNLLDFYKGIKKSAKGFEEEYKMLGEKIEFIDHQLVTLKNDLENKIDLKDSIATFIGNEQKNIEILQKNIGTMMYNYDFVTQVHDSISNKVQSLLIQDVE